MSDLVNFDNDLIVYQGDSGNVYTLSGEFQLITGAQNISSFIPYVTWSSNNTPSRFTGDLPFFENSKYCSGYGTAAKKIRFDVPTKPYLKIRPDDSASLSANEYFKFTMLPEYIDVHRVDFHAYTNNDILTDPTKLYGSTYDETEYTLGLSGSAIYQGEVIIDSALTLSHYKNYDVKVAYWSSHQFVGVSGAREYTADTNSIELGNWVTHDNIIFSSINLGLLYNIKQPGHIIKDLYLTCRDLVNTGDGTKTVQYGSYSSLPDYYNQNNFIHYYLTTDWNASQYMGSIDTIMSAKTWTASVKEYRLPDPEFIAY